MTPYALAPEARNWRQAIKRGFLCRCPHCGEGKIYSSYLKIVPECGVCGEELHHQRADDAPPYATIFIVGHVVIGALLVVESFGETIPMWVHMLAWSALALVLSLVLLPLLKGALVGYQWALRMHGFETAPPPQLRRSAQRRFENDDAQGDHQGKL